MNTFEIVKGKLLEGMKRNQYLILCFMLLIGCGWTLLAVSEESTPTTLDYLDLFSQTFEIIQSRYLEETDPLILAEGAVEGMLLEISPYSTLMPLSGSSSIMPAELPASAGLVLGAENGMIRVIDVLPESPAQMKGILPGDFILRIGDKVTPYLPIERARRLLTGNPAQTVGLTIQSNISYRFEEISLDLQPVRIESSIVSTFTHDFLHLSFQGPLTTEKIDKIKDILHEHQALKGLILDLRHLNTGEETTGLTLADIFVDDSTAIASLCNKEKKIIQDLYASDGIYFGNFPIAVIIDNTSAGPAETCALALKSSKRAVLIGDHSFGKAVKIQKIPFNESFEIYMPDAYYCELDGTQLQEIGLAPDLRLMFPINHDHDPFIAAATDYLNDHPATQS